jgi:predicted RNA-binding Zn-ribbon protein involved in translation (DUF1610 family)
VKLKYPLQFFPQDIQDRNVTLKNEVEFMCKNNEYELIGQIIDTKKKKQTNLYSCPQCFGTYIKENRTKYRKLTPRYFLTDL